MSDINVSMSMVHFVRVKKLKGGRTTTRNIRTVHKPKTSVKIEGGKTVIDVIIDRHDVSASLTGTLDRSAGTIQMTPTSVVLKGYMKGRNFEMVGYNLDVKLTNPTRRSKGLCLK